MIIVITTCPSRKVGEKITNVLLEKHLAACVSMFPISSSFWWDKKFNTSDEFILLIKTQEDQYSKLESEILKEHPYECPEIISIPIKNGYSEYLDWVSDCVGN